MKYKIEPAPVENRVKIDPMDISEGPRCKLYDMQNNAYTCHRTLNYIYQSPWMMRKLIGMRAVCMQFEAVDVFGVDDYKLFAADARRMFKMLEEANRRHENRKRMLVSILKSAICGFGFAAAIVLGAAVCGWIAS